MDEPEFMEGEILQIAQKELEDWSKARLISLAQKDRNSPLAALPNDLVNKIHQHFYNLTNNNN